VVVDFHSHTLASDGTYTAAELLGAMKTRGVEVFSVSDHDTLEAYRTLYSGGVAIAEVAPARLVTGVEINTTYSGNEVHILGYGFPLGRSDLDALIEQNRRSRDERARQMIAQLVRGGHAVTYEMVRAEAAGDAPLGRPHVAKALIRAGIASSIEDAFRHYLSTGKIGYVPSHHIRPHDAVTAIARAGGVAVLAHPGRLKDLHLIDELVEAGIAGLEVFYPAHTDAQIARFREIASRHGLVMTAGSDFHDPRWNARGVGMDVDPADIQPFLDLVL
jgi:predicted metal-dependent phosphoesterase TrpH